MAKTSVKIGFDQITEIEQRRIDRRNIPAAEATAILNGGDEWRFHYTIKEAAEHSEIWFIFDQEENLIDLTYNNQWVTPFWPHEDIAILACKKMDIPGQVGPMPLDFWIDEVLDKSCREDQCLIALCPSLGSAALKTVDDVFMALAAYKEDPEAFWNQHFSEDTLFLTAKNIKAGPKGFLP